MADVDRRSLLLGAAASVVVSSQVFRSTSAAAAPDLTLQHEARILYRYNADFSAAVPWIAPGVVRLKGSAKSFHDKSLRVTWDSRLAEIVSPTVLVAAGGEVHELAGKTSTRGHTATLVLPLLEFARFDSRAVEWAFLPQIFPKAGFSDIGLDAVDETTVQLVGRSGTAPTHARQEELRGLKSVDGAVWGGELSVIWDGAAESGEASRFTHPRIVLLESVGPGPVPAGARITLTADAATVGALTCVEARRDEATAIPIRQSKESSDGTATLVLILKEPLQRGSKARFELQTSDQGTTSPSAKVRSACVVSLDGGNNQPALQRPTGKDAQTLNS